jgi:aryl-alcohol dehydrogenase-like predicted oxidoreductase
MEMRYAAVTGTQLTPSVLCLGTADMFTRIPRDESLRILDAFVETGGTFIDTASVYSDWIPGPTSRVEKELGEWLSSRGRRDSLVLATKGAHPGLNTMHVPRLSPEAIESDLHASLRNLRTDIIDLYYLHRDDAGRPVEEIVDVLESCITAGKIRAYGCSNWKADRIRAANAYASQKGVRGFAANQPLWNLAVIDPAAIGDPTIVVMDEPTFRYHVESGLACVPFSAQANGLFQRMRDGTTGDMRPSQRRLYGSSENAKRFERAQTLADETGQALSAIVLAYLTSQPFPVFPIIGCSSVTQLHDSLSSVGVQLTPAQVRFLEAGDRLAWQTAPS